MSSAQPRSPFFLVPLLLALSLAAVPAVFAATGTTPAVPVDQARWGELEPRAILGDTTFYLGNYEPGCNEPYWFDVDVESGVIFTATGSTLEVWDARTTPAEPSLGKEMCRPVLGTWKKTDENWYLKTIDAPPGDPTVALAGSTGGMGVLILRAPTPGGAAVFYQDEGRINSSSGEILSISSVVALEPTTTAYGFALTLDSKTVKIYDLDRVKTLTSTCREGSQEGNIACPGVYKGTLSDGGSPVNAVHIAGAGRYLITAFGPDLRIFDVTTPTAPQKVATLPDAPSAASGATSAQIEAWMQGGVLHFAIATRANSSKTVDVFRVPCIGTAGCTPVLVNSLILDTPSPINRLAASVDGGIPYLYAGSEGVRGTGPQREFLFDMSSPTAPSELTPQVHPEGYWGWYYEQNGGFNSVAPYTARVWNGHLYRGAWSILDVHALIGNIPPQADFRLPDAPVYGDTNVTFEDRSTRSPTEWYWTFDAPSANVDSTQQNPSWLIPAAGPFPRDYRVELEVCNDVGCDTAAKTMTALDPVPSGSVGANVSSIQQCGTVTFAADVLGKPPIALAWDVESGTGTSLGVTGSGTILEWQVPASQAPGNYRAVVTASNTVSGQPTSVLVQSPLVQVVELPQLALNGASAGPSQLGTVSFSVDAEGATRWRWDFDGNGSFDLDTTDPNIGPNPTHSYAAVGDYYPVVEVRNCRDGIETFTFSSPVVVDEVVRLEVRQFQAQVCSPFGCFASLGQQIAFSVEIGGNPEEFVVDWGDNTSNTYAGSILDGNGRATISHAYTTAAASVGYVPVLTATRGTQTVTAKHGTTPSDPPGTPGDQIFVSGSTQPASVSILGPGTVTPNQFATFRATVSNCSPAPTSWTWSTGGGQIEGSATGDTIEVRWTLTGSKTVTATAQGGACGGTRGSRSVNVSSSGGGGGTGGGGGGSSLSADFTISNGTPAPGEAVTFDAGASSGGVESYYWNFGDGTTLGPGNHPKPQHAFAAPGNYTVLLEISKASTTCPMGLCTASRTRTVVVAGEPQPPAPTFVADLEVLTETLAVGSPIAFDASASGPEVESYYWSFGDGMTLGPGNHPKPQHVYAKAGSYTVSVEVTRADDGCPLGLCSATAQVTLDVVEDARCDDDPTALCLLDDRYEVRLDFTGADGESRVALPVPGVGSNQAGLFYFQRPENWEVLVKMVDGCEFNDFRWLFAGWSSDLSLELQVLDRATGTTRLYFKPGGVSAAAETDFEAFPCDDGEQLDGLALRAGAGGLEPRIAIDNAAPLAGESVTFDASASLGSPSHFFWRFGDGTSVGPITEPVVSHTFAAPGSYEVLLEISKSSGLCDFGLCAESTTIEVVVGGEEPPTEEPPTEEPPTEEPPTEEPPGEPGDEEPENPAAPEAGCTADADTLCLLGGRFAVSLAWTDDQGELRDAPVVPLISTNQSGLFYFRREANWEALVKMVDGCSFNDRFWVFASAATELPLALTVVDTLTEDEIVYVHGGGGPAGSVADLDAFECTE